MRAAARVGEQASRPTAAPAQAPAPVSSPRRAGPSPAQALRLQRAAGNRAAARFLARWVKHPDADKKGVMVPDVVAEDFTHFNPPQNK
jgi:hypothetical protein